MYCTGAYAASRSVRVADIGNHTARDGHDNASGIALDGNRMIWTWKLDLLFFHVSVSPFCSCSALQELRDVPAGRTFKIYWRFFFLVIECLHSINRLSDFSHLYFGKVLPNMGAPLFDCSSA